jgi:hypothetical protein
VRYVAKEHMDHLIQCIKEKYKLTKDWTGDLYCRIKLKWDYGCLIFQCQGMYNATASIMKEYA